MIVPDVSLQFKFGYLDDKDVMKKDMQICKESLSSVHLQEFLTKHRKE